MKTIEITDEMYEQIKPEIKENLKNLESSCYKDMIGKNFFFRTVTYHLTGKVKSIFGKFLELEDAAWIADSGRFSKAIKEGSLNEVEPVETAFVSIDAITDFFPWVQALPRKQK